MLDVYKIDAHRSKVKDLPVKFMEALLASMHDKSYGNDVCASFGMVHPSKDKMYHLWVDSKNPDEREYPEAKRFYLNVVELDEPFIEGDRSYLSSSLEEVEKILETDSLEEITDALSKILPVFEAFLKKEKA